MLVLDLEGRVISLNPAAERILNAPAKQVEGKLVKEPLPAYPEKRLADPGKTEIELGFGEGTSLRYYMLTNSLLNDFRGLEVGRLLLLSDVTERKRAQSQILEQQKVQAVLEERAGLARELHLIAQVEGRDLGQQFRFTSGDALVDQVDVCQGLLQEREQVVRQYDQRAFLDLNAFGKVAVQGSNLNGRAFLDDGLEKVKTEWGW